MSAKTKITNTFNKGLNLDSPLYQTPQDLYTYLENGTFITHEGNELILQNEKGTTVVGFLKENYVPLAIKSYGNVAYIVSAEAEYLEIDDNTGIYKETNNYHKVILNNNETYNITVTYDITTGHTDDEITDILNSGGTYYADVNVTVSQINISERIYDPVSLNTPKQISFNIDIQDNEPLIVDSTGYNTTVTITKITKSKTFVRLTGRGEIGTFPSPDYNNLTSFNCSSEGCDYKTTLINKYSPLYNYKGDNNIIVGEDLVKQGYGEFNSINFNFQDDKVVEIVAIQPVYDGTVNIIFTDGYNRPKIINSRFSVRENNQVEIIERSGNQDSNLYTEDNFNNTLNHIFTTNKIVNFEFRGQNTKGGNLPAGTYRYYFKYVTQDGEESSVIAESFNIPVFFGNKLNELRGGISNENTSKSNILRLVNLDTSYDKVKIYFSYRTGQAGVDTVPTIYEIANAYNFTGNILEITHTGFESTLVTDNSVLNLSTQQIFTYKTGCEIKGRLMIGNIVNKTFNTTVLRDFARNITVGYGVKEFEYSDLQNDNINLSEIDIPLQFDVKTSSSSWKEGYYNPRNIHDFLAYKAGETYCFSAEFIFDDGFKSPLFPVRGIDATKQLPYQPDFTQAGLNSDNLFNSFTSENIKGIYRFPFREQLDDKDSTILVKGKKVRALHPVFNVPNITSQLEELGIVGIRFYRAERKKDQIDQGIVLPTFFIPSFEPTATHSEYGKLWDKTDNLNSISDVDLFPILPNGLTEACSRNGSVNDVWDNGSIPKKQFIGVDPVYLSTYSYTNPNPEWRIRAYSFIGANIVTNPLEAQKELQNFKYKIKKIGNYSTFYSGRCRSTVSDYYFSLLHYNNYEFVQEPFRTVEVDYVQSQSTGKTLNSFKSNVEFRAFVADDVSSYSAFSNIGLSLATDFYDDNDGNVNRTTQCYTRHFYKFNDYLGLYFKDTIPFEYPPVPVTNYPDRAGSIALNDFTRLKKELNGISVAVIYSEGGPRESAELNSLYKPEFELFTPISKQYYFNNDIASKYVDIIISLESEGKDIITGYSIDVFGGDCYVMPIYRRIFQSGLDRGEIAEGDENRILRADIDVGYSIQFVAESDYNPVFREQTVGDSTTDDIKTFYPYNVKRLTSVDKKNNDNPWRNNRSRETDEYNSGGNYYRSDIAAKPFDVNKPFIQNNFNTRISFSNIYSSNSFENAYRFFNPLAYKDYSRNLGEIIALRSINGRLVCVQENGITIIPVNERIAQTGDSAGEVFFNDTQVLADPKHVKYLTENYGSRWQQSIISSDNTIYGVDIDNAKIWRVGNGLELISDFKIQSFLRSIQPLFKDKTYSYAKTQVAAYFDKFKSSIVFSFIKSEENEVITLSTPITCPEVTYSDGVITIGEVTGGDKQYELAKYGNNLYTLVYNEVPSNQWQTFYGWYPNIMFNIRNNTYSFNIINHNNYIHQHYTNNLYSTYYGDTKDFIVEFNVTGGSMYHWIFENLQLVSNEIYPYKIEYVTDQGLYVQTLRPRNVEAVGADGFLKNENESILTADIVYKEGQMYLPIRKDNADTGLIYDYLNQEIRDKYCKIRLYYNSNKKIVLQAVLTTISQSMS